MVPLQQLRNIGEQSARWLASVGVHTDRDLAELGAVEAYRRAKFAFPDRVSLNLLWSLQGALLDIPWNRLPEDMKRALRAQIDGDT